MTEYIYTIYKATNRVNGKTYEGFDSSWPCRLKYHLWLAKSNRSHTAFHSALRKYGAAAFDWEVLFQAKGDWDVGKWMLNTIEPYFIREHHGFTEGYNETLGGEGATGSKKSRETRKKISESKIGRPRLDMVGKSPSENNLKAVRESKKVYRVTRIFDKREMDIGNFTQWINKTSKVLEHI